MGRSWADGCCDPAAFPEARPSNQGSLLYPKDKLTGKENDTGIYSSPFWKRIPG